MHMCFCNWKTGQSYIFLCQYKYWYANYFHKVRMKKKKNVSFARLWVNSLVRRGFWELGLQYVFFDFCLYLFASSDQAANQSQSSHLVPLNQLSTKTKGHQIPSTSI